MFTSENGVYKSDLLDLPSVRHGFSTRAGGVSVLEHTKSMSLSFGLGDDDETVRSNMRILCENTGCSYDGLVASPQYHSAHVRYVTRASSHEGIDRENTDPSDGFVTDEKGVALLVRVADCTPILFAGEKSDGSAVVAAVHAGWRGTVAGIAAAAVNEMVRRGAVKETIRAAIGQCIRDCCFEVRGDFVDAVCAQRGADFAKRHITERGGKLFCDMVSMNVEILEAQGVSRDRTDVSHFCTACEPERFHSHRATGGRRGTMGAVIGLV